MTFFLQKLFIFSWKKKQIADGFKENEKRHQVINWEWKKIQKPSNWTATLTKVKYCFPDVFVNISL